MGKWGVILRDNPNAIHIGLTATPRIVVGGGKERGRKRRRTRRSPTTTSNTSAGRFTSIQLATVKRMAT